jgi:CheY-like chemotaxis protein
VHGIIQDYGGSINVVSKLGQGTKFIIYLPLTDEDVSQSATSRVEIPGGNERILFIDDEQSVAEVNKQILERLGYKVFDHTDSIKALESFRSDPAKYDLLITDMSMPNMTGKKLATEIKKIRSDIPVILCTGYSDQIDEISAKALDVDAFVMKPIMMKNIANTIRRVLDKEH